MKRLVLIVVLALLVLACATAQTVYYKDQATLQWDPVTVDAAGDPFLPTDLVRYQVYIYDYVAGVTDPQDPAGLISVEIVEMSECLIVFPYRTSWAAGVRTMVTDQGGNIDYSEIAWSYVATDAGVDGPFLYLPFPTLRAPLNLRDSGM